MTEETNSNNNEQTQITQTHTPAPAEAVIVKSAQQTNRMQNMMVGVVGALVIMAGIQVFQTQQLLAAVNSGSINPGTQQTQQSSGLGIQSQVGGCG